MNYTIAAEVIAHRLCFRVAAVECALRTISNDPTVAYLEIATLPEKDAVQRLWKALASADAGQVKDHTGKVWSMEK